MTTLFQNIDWRRHALFAGFIVPLFAFVGPFGTVIDLTFTQRLGFWGIAIVGCGVFFFTLSTFTLNAKAFANIPVFWRVVLGVFIAAFPSTVLIYLLQTKVRGLQIDASYLPWLWLMVFSIGLFIKSVFFFVQFGNNLSKTRVEKKQLTDMNMDTDAGVLAFLARLPKDLGISPISLSMQDHYIQVVTERGSTMLYMNFTDAMQELQNYPGFRIHRSHWVARAQIKSLKRDGRSHIVSLADGRTLPVSNTYKAKIVDFLG